MFRVRLNELSVHTVASDGISADFVSAETSVLFDVPGSTALGLSYRRPVRVESEAGVIPIKDHVMIARLGALAVALFLAIRRLVS